MTHRRPPAGPTAQEAGSPARRDGSGLRDRLARFVYRPAICLGGVVLLAVMALTVLDVALRYAFNAPVRGTFELTELAMLAIALLGLGHAQHLGQHIAIDLLYERLPAVGRATLDVLVGLTSLLLVLTLTWQLGRLYGRMATSGEVTAVLGLPVYPVVTVAVVSFGLFALALLFDLAGACRRVARTVVS